MKLPEKYGGGEVITLPSGFPSRHLPFSSKLLIPAFTGKKGSKFGKKMTLLVQWQISAPLLANREPVGDEPVGNQSGKSVHQSGSSKNRPKTSIFEHFQAF